MTGRAATRDAGAPAIALWSALGVATGLALAVGAQHSAKWTGVALAALLGAGVLPIVAERAGSVERLVYLVFILGFAAQLEFAPLVWGYQKVSGPYGLQISLVLMAALALIALHWGKTYPDGFPRLRVRAPLLVWSLLFLGAGLLSLENSPDLHLSIFGLFEILSLTVIGAAVSHHFATEDGIRTARGVLAVGLVLEAAVIVLEFATGIQLTLTRGIRQDYGWGDLGRFAGFFGAPSVAGTYMLVCLLFVLAEAVTSRGRARRRLSIVFTVGVLGVVLTQARATWGAMTIGMGGLLAHFYRRRDLDGRTLLKIAGAAALAVAVVWPTVSARLATNHAEDAMVRWNLIRIAWEMIQAHPVVGVGINTATSQVDHYAEMLDLVGRVWVFIVHNQFMLIAVETGVVGLAAFVALYVWALRTARRCARSVDPFVSQIGAVLFWALVALVWSLSLDHVSGGMTYDLVWFLFGAASGLSLLRRARDGGTRIVVR